MPCYRLCSHFLGVRGDDATSRHPPASRPNPYLSPYRIVTIHGDAENTPEGTSIKQPPPRLPGSAKGKLRVIADDDEHLAGFHDYLP